MNLEARKILFIQEFLRLENEQLISSLEDLLRFKKAELFEQTLTPMSIEQLNKEIDSALQDSENDRGTNARDLKKIIQKWK